LNGEMSREEMQEVLDHLDECPACETVFQNMLSLKTMAPEISAGLSREFYDFEESPYLFKRPWIMMAVAAAVLLALVGGLFLLKGVLLRQPGAELAVLLETAPYEYVPPIMRGDATPVEISRKEIMTLYSDEEYAEFLRHASSWTNEYPEDSRMLFFAGVASYLLKNYSDAERNLSRSLSTDNRRREETLWYLANTRLRLDQVQQGRQLLLELTPMDHPYAVRAEKTLEVLDKQK